MNFPKVFAHRGGTQWAPENTMAAFRRSLEAGVHGIELDIHRCHSGELVVIHKEDLGDTTNGVGLVKEATYPEIARLSAGLWFDQEFADERVPLLQDVLELVQGRAVLNIELKTTPIEYPGIEDDLLQLLSWYPKPETVIISAFDHKLIKCLHGKAPSFKVALLAAAYFVDLKEYAAKMGATYLHVPLDCCTTEAVAEAHDAGLTVNVWRANSPKLWSRAIKFGADGIITDDPSGLQHYLEQQRGMLV